MGLLPAKRKKMAIQTKPIKVNVEVRGINISGRPLTSTDVKELREENTKVVGKGDERRVVFDQEGNRFGIFNRMVEGWEVAKDLDGKAIECTPEVMKDIFTHDPEFATSVINKINYEVAVLKGEIEKNS